mgnify:CR=1 FL=1
MSNGELGMRNVVALHCDSEREVAHGSHRFHGFSSSQATEILIWSLNGRTPKESKSVKSSGLRDSEKLVHFGSFYKIPLFILFRGS